MEEMQKNSTTDKNPDYKDDFKEITRAPNEADCESTESTDSYDSVLSSSKNTANGDVCTNNKRGDENANVNEMSTLQNSLRSTDINVQSTGNSKKHKLESSDEDDQLGEESENDSCLSTCDDESTGGEESDLEDNMDTEMDVAAAFSSPHEETPFLARRQSNPVLPETVTLLQTTQGSKVYLVGTAHFSLESQEDVAKTIQATQPDTVMVELCNSRVNILALDEDTILEEAKNLNFEKMHTAIRQNGFVQGCLYLLLLSMSAHITKQLGMAPGGEFRRAFAEARKVPGCLVQLGDRPIQITLNRALSALSCWQKMKLAWYVITNKDPISKEEVERCKQRDLLEELLAEMTGEFPALSTVFVKERDMYLAYTLRLAATPIQNPHAVNGPGLIPQVVVGVVGIGHVSGIVDNWEKVTERDLPSILSVPKPSIASKVIKKTIRYSLVGVILWGGYRLVAPRIGFNGESAKKSVDWLVGLVRR